MTDDRMRFAFGANWQSFVETALNVERVTRAASSLRRMLNVEHLRGRSFLDIGCGSGLFSLAACLLGAERVVAFDYDPDSVQASLSVRERAGIAGERWLIQQGSILDNGFLDTLDSADIVYSWGVLHHTGGMWQAIDNAASKMKPGGQFALALYNDVQRVLGGSAMWWHIKRVYNLSPRPAQQLMEGGYSAALLLNESVNLRNPLKIVREYSSESGRGMDFWHDVRDWLGGFPYEYATPAVVFNYLHGKFGFELEYMTTSSGVGCNEYTFRNLSVR
jgi:SAM-dependent methyltransferase